MALESVDTTGAAFIAGLVTSVHCVGMCGPLSCSLAGLRGSDSARNLTATAYHGGRVLSYLLIGAIAGALGHLPLQAIADSPAALLPWFLVAALLLTATGWGKRIPLPPFLLRWVARTRLRASGMSAARGGLALGLITPLLPCGPLYIMFGIALVSGSPLRGAEMMLAFAMGTIPLLWFAQSRMGVWQQKLGPRKMLLLQRSVAIMAAVVLAWRMRGTLWFVEHSGVGCGCH